MTPAMKKAKKDSGNDKMEVQDKKMNRIPRRHIIFEVSTVTVFSARAVFVHRDGEEHYVGES